VLSRWVDGVDESLVVDAWRDPNFYYYESVYRQVFSLTFRSLWGLIDSAYTFASLAANCVDRPLVYNKQQYY